MRADNGRGAAVRRAVTPERSVPLEVPDTRENEHRVAGGDFQPRCIGKARVLHPNPLGDALDLQCETIEKQRVERVAQLGCGKPGTQAGA